MRITAACAWPAVLLLAGLASGAGDTNAPPLVTVAGASTNRITHDAVGARVVASSTHRGAGSEGEPKALVDGDLTTRWSSDYASPQQIEIYLKEARKLDRLRIHWEQACATKYRLSVSSDGKDWKRVHLYFNDKVKPEDRVDEVDLRGISAGMIRLELLSNVNTNWGYSIYEMELLSGR